MAGRAPSRSPASRALAGTLPAVSGLLALLCTTTTYAAEGYFQNGIGAREKALAGAGVANSADATAVSLNPAGLVNVQSQANIAASFLYLDGGFTSWGTGGIDVDGQHDSDPGWLFIPNLAATWRVNWGLVDAIAFSAYGNGGVATHYDNMPNAACGPASGVFCGGHLGVKLKQTFYSLGLAKQVAPGISVGVAPIIARQTGKLYGVGAFATFSSDPANFTNMGTDESWGVGVRGGVEWKVARNVRLGLAGHAPINMTNFDRYRGLLAEQGDFDIPGTLQVGVAVDVTPALTLMADYRRIWYGSVASVANPSTNLLLFPNSLLGADNGAGFGVRDVDVIKLGAEWRASQQLTLRGGYSYNTAPIGSRDADLNIMTLGIVQHHITGGFKYQVSRNLDLEFAAMYAPTASVTGVELGAPLRNVEIEMSQLEFTVGVVYRFGERRPEPLK